MPEDRSKREVSEVVSIGGSDVSVTLALTALKPLETEGKWFTKVSVFLSRDRRRPIVGLQLYVKCNGVDVSVRDSKTDPKGFMSCNIELPGPGEHVIVVGVPDTICWAPVTVSVSAVVSKSAEEKATDRIKSKISRAEEQRKLDVLVKPSVQANALKDLLEQKEVMQAKKELRELAPITAFTFFARPECSAREYYVTAELGVKGVWVEILDPGNPRQDQRRIVRETGEDGAVRLFIKPKGPRQLTCSISSAPNLPRLELNLAGPEVELAPIVIPRVPVRVLKGSWKQLFSWAEREAAKLNRQQRRKA